jgi:hypothetical protein
LSLSERKFFAASFFLFKVKFKAWLRFDGSVCWELGGSHGRR